MRADNCDGEERERFIVTMDGQVEWIDFLGKEKVVRDFELVVSGTRETCIESDVAVSFRNDTFSNFRNLSTVRDKVVDQTFLFNRLRKYISIDARFDAL